MNHKETISEISDYCKKLANSPVIMLANQYSFTFGMTSFITTTAIMQAKIINFDVIHRRLVIDDNGEVILVVNTLNYETVTPDEFEKIKLALALNEVFAKVEDITEKSLNEYTHGLLDYFEV